jgi:large subunit ribosomal protein L13
MRTYAPKPQHVERRWYVVDADGAVLGRLASEVAKILRGKHKPIFAPHADTGDHVVVVNARRVRLTGGKEEKKVAYRHSGYPGGLRETLYSRLLATRPAFVVERAVRGMLPKNRLGRAMIRKLNVYEGPEHPHRAQNPVPLKLGETPAWEGLPAPKPASARPSPKPRPAARPASADEPATTRAKRTTAKRTTAKRQGAKTEAQTERRPKTTTKSTATSSAKRTTKSSATSKSTRTSRAKSSEGTSGRRTRRSSKREKES